MSQEIFDDMKVPGSANRLLYSEDLHKVSTRSVKVERRHIADVK